MQIKTASITWLETGEPYSSQFDDIYFSRHDGLQESQYVFIQQNHLPQRWDKPQNLTIGELGFGSGLNFLASIDCWLAHATQDSEVTYVSFEQFPFSYTDYQQMGHLLKNRWPQLLPIFTELEALYPLRQNYQELYLCNHRVHLKLFFQDALSCLQNEPSPSRIPKIDAWYLDGFDPRKNTELWNSELYHQIARYSQSATTFSTFTAAGHVRRGLMEVGFEVCKQKGFGRKREMLNGSMPD